MASPSGERFALEYHARPGRRWSDARIAAFTREVRAVGETCLSPLPEYQCFVGTREGLADKVITVARRRDGGMAGFASAVVFPVETLGEVLHLGLVCVRPEARGGMLTHSLISRLVTHYLVRERPFDRVWVTNVACVLSSLGNFALNFRDVFPSPLAGPTPRREHLLIAEAFDRYHREKAYVQSGAVFDRTEFVFRGSGRDTAFQKSGDDTRFHHRSPALNAYYTRMLRWEDGDEMLQIGSASLLDGLLYFAGGRRRVMRRLARLAPSPPGAGTPARP